MEREQYGIEKIRSEAIKTLLGTLPEEQREQAGHALSILVDRMAENATDEDSMKEVARLTDSPEHLQTLAELFQQIGNELRVQSFMPRKKPIDRNALRERTTKALRTRIFAAVEAGDGAHETRIRRTDLSPHQTHRTAKEKFLIGITTGGEEITQ